LVIAVVEISGAITTLFGKMRRFAPTPGGEMRIPFTATIEAADPDFRDRQLMPELPGILKWALAGLAEYRRIGLAPPQVITDATEDYREDMDIVGDWIEERCIRDPASTVASAALYADYSQFADREMGKAVSSRRFGRELAERGFKKEKGTGGERMTTGLQLKFQLRWARV
jgi:putative DNA primase/helicase